MDDDKRTKTEPATDPVELPEVEAGSDKKPSALSGFFAVVKKTMNDIGDVAERKTNQMQAELDTIPGANDAMPTYGTIEEKITGKLAIEDTEDVTKAHEDRKKRAMEKLKKADPLENVLANEDD